MLQKINKEVTKKRKSFTRYNKIDGKYPGDKVQIDIKYVPNECIKFNSYGERFYQITAIDKYSRKRVFRSAKVVERRNKKT